MSSIGLLPVETLVNVFSLCSYMELLSISRVCRVWKTVVESDPSLRVQTFKSTGDDIGMSPYLTPTQVTDVHTIMTRRRSKQPFTPCLYYFLTHRNTSTP